MTQRDEAQEELHDSWQQWLMGFEELYHAVFAPLGYPKGDALVAYEINRMYNRLGEIFDADNDEPGSMPWK